MYDEVVLFDGKTGDEFVSWFIAYTSNEVETPEAPKKETEVEDVTYTNEAAQKKMRQLKQLLKHVKANAGTSDEHITERFLEHQTYFRRYLAHKKKRHTVSLRFNTSVADPTRLRAKPRVVSKTIAKAFLRYEDPYARMALAIKLIDLCKPGDEHSVYVIPQISRVEENG